MTRNFTKTQLIRQLIAEGKTTKEIVALTKCKAQQIYSIKYYDKNRIQTHPSLWQRVKDFFRSI